MTAITTEISTQQIISLLHMVINVNAHQRLQIKTAFHDHNKILETSHNKSVEIEQREPADDYENSIGKKTSYQLIPIDHEETETNAKNVQRTG